MQNSNTGAAVQVFKVLDPGHSYELLNWMAPGSQVLNFIKKELAEGEPTGTLETVQVGTTNEAVLLVLINRIELLDKKFPCQENKDALVHLQEALAALGARTHDRVERGVEGKHLD